MFGRAVARRGARRPAADADAPGHGLDGPETDQLADGALDVEGEVRRGLGIDLLQQFLDPGHRPPAVEETENCRRRGVGRDFVPGSRIGQAKSVAERPQRIPWLQAKNSVGLRPRLSLDVPDVLESKTESRGRIPIVKIDVEVVTVGQQSKVIALLDSEAPPEPVIRAGFSRPCIPGQPGGSRVHRQAGSHSDLATPLEEFARKGLQARFQHAVSHHLRRGRAADVHRRMIAVKLDDALQVAPAVKVVVVDLADDVTVFDAGFTEQRLVVLELRPVGAGEEMKP